MLKVGFDNLPISLWSGLQSGHALRVGGGGLGRGGGGADCDTGGEERADRAGEQPGDPDADDGAGEVTTAAQVSLYPPNVLLWKLLWVTTESDTDLKLCAHRSISHSLAFGSSRRLEALSDEQRTRARVLEEAQRDRKVATLIYQASVY